MDENAKRFTRWMILLHGFLFGLVLITVIGVARTIYVSCREQIVSQAEDRLRLLAKETAGGIENHYHSIFSNMDLLRQAQTDNTAGGDASAGKAVAMKSAQSPFGVQPAGVENVQPSLSREQRLGRVARALEHTDPRQFLAMPSLSLFTAVSSLINAGVPGNNPVVGQVLWQQLTGRISLLFTINNMVAPGSVHETSVLGGNNDQIPSILAGWRDWIQQLKSPSLSRFGIYDGIRANLVCIPLPSGRDLVAVVPIQTIEDQFLAPISTGSANASWLIDEAGTAMAASRPELVGVSVAGISDPQLQDLSRKFIRGHSSGTQVVPRNFKVGSANFGPAIITAEQVTISGRQWELFVTTSLDDVDGAVAKLLRRGLFWCIFVVIAETAILVSTSVLMIRTRTRIERVRHEMLTKELQQARSIQLAWLPDGPPARNGVDIAALNSPASHISGDFYNWFELPDGRLVVTVGDVTGHGMAAAFLMATTQLLVRNTITRVKDPGRCLEEVNRQLCVQVFNGQFVTMLVVVVDLDHSRMEVATAGHPPLLVADGESFQPIRIEPQLMLGAYPDTQYPTERFDLSPHASLLLYTDGVVECPNARRDRFGDDRLRRSLYGRYANAKQIIDQVIDAVNTFRGARDLDDDLTLVAVQLQPVPGAKLNVVLAV